MAPSKPKSGDEAMKFWTQLIRVLSECAKGRENLSVMGTLQKTLPSEFVIEAIREFLNLDLWGNLFNRGDLLLSLTLFLNHVYLDTELPEERLVEDKELKNVLIKLAKFVLHLDLTGQVEEESMEAATSSELVVRLGISVVLCFKSYFSKVLAGTAIKEDSFLVKRIVYVSRKIAHTQGFNLVARKYAFETLQVLGAKYELESFNALREMELNPERTAPTPSDDLQALFMVFVEKLQTSPRIKDLVQDEKMEMVDIIQYIEIITNPSSENTQGKNLPKTIVEYAKKNKEMSSSKYITLENLIRRMRAFLLPAMRDESMQPTCVSIFRLLTWMLQRDFQTIEDLESTPQGSVEQQAKAVNDARMAHQARQALFADMGLVDALFEAVLSSPGGGIEHCAFQLGEEMFRNGNRKVQEVMNRYARTHDSLGRFFRNIRDKISAASKDVIRTQNEKKLYPDLYEPPASSLEASIAMFGFLQQLCEGSFLSMQQMLYAQTFNRKSYNLVQEAIDFAVAVARDRDSIRTLDEIFILALGRALDFLIEVTQGPCAENQLCISGSAVVEVCGYIACTSQFECLTKPEMGYGIKVKAFTLLSACLEGRSDLIVEKRLAAKFELSFYNSTVIQLHSIIKELELA